jgi:hypothetical protein
MATNTSFTNGHPTRKFRNIRPIAIIPIGDCDMYNFEGVWVNLPVEANSFNVLLQTTEEQVKKFREDGLTEKQLCEANISKTRLKKVKIQMLQIANMGKEPSEEAKKLLFGDYIEFAHGVVMCAYLGAMVWENNFGIQLADGTMPLVPEDEIGALCRNMVKETKKHQLQKEEEKQKKEDEQKKKKMEEVEEPIIRGDALIKGVICKRCNNELPIHTEKQHLNENHPIHKCPHKIQKKYFTDFFTPASIEKGEKRFKLHLEHLKQKGETPHSKIERYSKVFYWSKGWANGENNIDECINFQFKTENTNEKDFEEIMDDYDNKITLYLYLQSTYYTDEIKIKDGYELFLGELLINKYKITQQLNVGDDMLLGFIAIHTEEEWNDIQEKNSKAKVMVKNEKDNKKMKGHLCCCGCNTFQKKMLKTTCCGARYVNAEHQTKDWSRHKCMCDKYRNKTPFYLPINREEELAMILCPMSCEGCDFCEYQPRFALIENVD